jgi:3-phenylpropionate/trans-cinnamate dioxygenase ferredoxin subunit
VGGRKLLEVAGLSVGIFNVDGTFYALRNRCPHQGAPLCLGSVKGMALPSMPGEYRWAREGEILRCPWHGWEFDLKNGRSICDPNGVRVKAYEITVEAGTAAAAERGTSPNEPAQPEEAEALTAETYPVTVEDRFIVLHL